MAKRSRGVIVATLLARNLRLAASLRLRPRRPVDLGARHLGFSLDQSLAYVDWVLRDYEARGLGGDRLAGARVLELGPGDNLGVALGLVGRGASQVVCLDRFVTIRDPEQQRRIHSALREAMPPAEREKLAAVMAPDGGLLPDQDAIVLLEGTGVEEADRVASGPFDAVISRAVLAHVWDLDPAFEVMDRLLAPGGVMIHRIDLSDHRLFSDAGHNPLTFLTVSDLVWDRMRSRTGLPNRLLVGYYRAKLAELGYESELLATKVTGRPDDLPSPIPAAEISAEARSAAALIEQIRPKLLRRFRDLPDEDLAIAGVFATGVKPPARSLAPGAGD
jgi:SAM-dependent methyltransferase